jgi:hypothetical protein
LRCFPDFFAKIFHTSVNLEVSKVRQCINNPLAELFLCLEYFIDLFLCFNICLEINPNQVWINPFTSIIENLLNTLMNGPKFLFFNNLFHCFLKIFTNHRLILFFGCRLFELFHFLISHAEECHVFFTQLVFDVCVCCIMGSYYEGAIEYKLF